MITDRRRRVGRGNQDVVGEGLEEVVPGPLPELAPEELADRASHRGQDLRPEVAPEVGLGGQGERKESQLEPGPLQDQARNPGDHQGGRERGENLTREAPELGPVESDAGEGEKPPATAGPRRRRHRDASASRRQGCCGTDGRGSVRDRHRREGGEEEAALEKRNQRRKRIRRGRMVDVSARVAAVGSRRGFVVALRALVPLPFLRRRDDEHLAGRHQLEPSAVRRRRRPVGFSFGASGGGAAGALGVCVGRGGGPNRDADVRSDGRRRQGERRDDEPPRRRRRGSTTTTTTIRSRRRRRRSPRSF
mmetsp:Transcript_1410/g.3516  ORF Transcript_1410/g.3516 Transcript_1410/m.3516 type:complete len:306 (+) Transcript_1410:460-1377(+)